MLHKYYYLVASLPYLEFGEKLPITRDVFLAECEKWLSPGDFRQVSEIDINDLKIRTSDPGTIKAWKLFDLGLREELKEARVSRKIGTHIKIPDSVKDVFEEQTPLFMERQVQKKRWDFLEEKEFGYHFDINTLMIYCLKLQIIERLAAFDREKGEAVFEGLCEVSYGG